MRSRAFIRVSDDRQDQASQERAVDVHVTTRGYLPVGEPYRMDGSAYHGKQIKLLQQAIDDMLAGEFDVLVFSASSRMWRGRSAAQAVVLIDEAEQHGARFDFAGEPMISTGGTPPEYIESIRLQAFQVNRRESDMKSERAKNGHELARQLGVVAGKAPWGTEIVCSVCGHVTARGDDGAVSKCGHIRTKHLRPSADALQIPGIIARTIAGESTVTIAAWLGCHESLVGRVIERGALYADLGLISHSDAAAALAALRSRVRGIRTATVRDPALLVPRCVCGAKAYRIYSYGGTRPFYRCRAKCGRPMIPAELLDAEVTAIMADNLQPHMGRVWIAGDDSADRADKLRAEAMRAYAAGDRAKFAELDAAASEADAEPKVRPHWAEVETGDSEADYYDGLTPEERRAYLASYEIHAELIGAEVGVIMAPRWAARQQS